MHSSNRRTVALVGALAITFGAAACSKQDPAPTTPSTGGTSTSAGASPTDTPSSDAPTDNADAPAASDLLEKVKTQTDSATSGAFKGDVTQNGKKMTLEFVGTSDGKVADVTLEMEGEGTVRIISVGGSAYMQADKTFWKAQGAPAKVQAAGDKFVKAPGDSADLTKSLNLKSFLDEAFGAVKASELSEKVGSETVNGVDCWVLVDKGGATKGALYVSKDKNELVRFTGSPASPGSIDFSKWNETPDVKAPEASQIIAIN